MFANVISYINMIKNHVFELIMLPEFLFFKHDFM